MSETNETQMDQVENQPQSFFMFCLDDFDKLTELFSGVNKAALISIYDLPQPASKYFNPREFNTATELVNMMLGYEQNEDEKWRITKFGQQPSILVPDVEGKKMINLYEGIPGEEGKKMLSILDCKGFMIVADLQMVIIIPGEETIKAGYFRPNQVIRLQNLLLATMLLCKLENIKGENEGEMRLGFEYTLIGEQPKGVQRALVQAEEQPPTATTAASGSINDTSVSFNMPGDDMTSTQ